MNRMTPELHERIERLLKTCQTRTSIAAEVGVHPISVHRVASGFYRLRRRKQDESSSDRTARVLANWTPAGKDPTPVEIAEACDIVHEGRDVDDDYDYERSVRMRSRAHEAFKRAMRDSWAMLDRGFLVGACATTRALLESELRPHLLGDRRRTAHAMINELRRSGELTPNLGRLARRVAKGLSRVTHGGAGDRESIAALLGDAEIVIMRLRVELARKESA